MRFKPNSSSELINRLSSPGEYNLEKEKSKLKYGFGTIVRDKETKNEIHIHINLQLVKMLKLLFTEIRL